MAPLLTVDNLSVTYKNGQREVLALQNISFTVEPGEVICVLGPNGAGKTSLLKCICQLVLPSQGQITWSPTLNNNHRNNRLGVLLEGSRAFYWNLTGLENARYFAALKALPLSPETEIHIDNLFELVNLSPVKDRLASTYSTGMKKRLSLIIALLGNPVLLLLDEPTQGLDTAATAELQAYLQRISETGTTVLCASHDLAFTFNVATRLLYMESGQLQMWDWKTATAHYRQLVFLMVGDNWPSKLIEESNGLLTALPEKRIRLEACIEDQNLYRMLQQLIVEQNARVLHVYGNATSESIQRRNVD